MSEENNILLPDSSKLIVSSSPHLHGGEDVRKVMRDVIIALLPAAAAAVYFFGFPAVRVLLLCSVFCVGFEYVSLKLMNKSIEPVKDLSALVTGVLLAMNLDAGSPWWICLIGAFLAIVLAKQLFGGLGYNPFNPALVARVGLLIGFGGTLTSWSKPGCGCDAVSCATPLGIAAEGGDLPSYLDMFLGNIGGCLGETSALAIIIGGLYLLARKLIRWEVPFFYVATVALFSGIVHWVSPATSQTALFHVLAGGLMIGAFFMATDMVTSPVTKKGAIIFAVGCGVITCVIRIWGGYPEGVSFSILFMNAFTPLIDKMTTNKPFGQIRGVK